MQFRYVEIFKASFAEFRRAQNMSSGGGGDRMGGGPMRHGRMGGRDRGNTPYGGGGRGGGGRGGRGIRISMFKFDNIEIIIY